MLSINLRCDDLVVARDQHVYDLICMLGVNHEFLAHSAHVQFA